MIFTITSERRPATDLGYLLHKHPDKVQKFELNFGCAEVFYTEVSEERCTAALLLEIDPIHMIRGAKAPVSDSSPLAQYVNDKPYVCSSFMSVAIAQVFGSALGGRCKDKPELVEVAQPLIVSLYSLPSRGGEKLLRELFEPLGYTLTIESMPLDEKFPAWGKSPYFNVSLQKTATLHDFLTQLYILIPVLDRSKHYWVDEDEVEKLLAKGKDWLAGHPARDFIVSRYLKGRRNLAKLAIAGLSVAEDAVETEAAPENAAIEEKLESPIRLNTVRLARVVEELKNRGAQRVLDLGCGEGKLISLLAKDKYFQHISGADVSLRTLEIAADRLGLDDPHRRDKDRIHMFQASLMYRDKRFAGFDAIALVEVIEHLELDRLAALERVVFQFAHAPLVIVTTPNAEYNRLFENLPAGKFRHNDHRFEWSRSEFKKWCDAICARFGYSAEFYPLGDEDAQCGAPTQMAVFTLGKTHE